MSLLAVTVLGHDRPGIIAQATALIADLAGNLEDSTMTLLRGHFAMVLLVSTESPLVDVERALSVLAADGTLQVSVREVPREDVDTGARGSAYLLSVHGADRPGIVSAMTAVVAGAGGNITDLSTRLTGDLYVLLAEVDLPPSANAADLAHQVTYVAEQLGVDASFGPLDSDLM
jgi:glycine cleavage system transcriptional repressor